MKKQAQGGFTLIELMIVVAIIGILAAIAVPQYQQFQRKAKFSDVISQTGTYKSAVELCMSMNNGVKTACDAGATGENWAIPAAPSVAAGALSSIDVQDGKITAIAVSANGLNGETYVLDPTANGTTITWAKSGTCTTISPPIC